MTIAKPHEAMGLVSGRRERPACILVHGADRGAVFDLCRQLSVKASGGGADLDIIRLQEGQKDRLYAEVFSIPMFGGQHVIWLSAAGDGAAAAIESVLGSGQAGHLVIVDSDALPKSSKLRKLCEASPRAASIAIYEETAAEMRARLAARIAEQGMSIADDALGRLVEIASRERAAANREADKLIIYAHGQASIAIEDVDAVCGESFESSFDDMMDAVLEGSMEDADRFASVLEQAASRNVLGAALAALAKLQSLAAQVAQGQPAESIVKAPANAVFFKRQARVTRQLRLWPLAALLEAEEKIGSAILQARRHRRLESAITGRALLAVSWSARGRAGPRSD
jgi:DNA polymerase III subunit delta